MLSRYLKNQKFYSHFRGTNNIFASCYKFLNNVFCMYLINNSKSHHIHNWLINKLLYFTFFSFFSFSMREKREEKNMLSIESFCWYPIEKKLTPASKAKFIKFLYEMLCPKSIDQIPLLAFAWNRRS